MMEFKGVIDAEHFPSLLILFLSSTAVASALLLLLLMAVKNGKGKNLPPGNMGLPLIGETYQFVKAYKAFKAKDWVEERVAKYGGVFKTSLMGSPTVVMTGQAGNRFLFQCDPNVLVSNQPFTARRIFGRTSIFELDEVGHRRMRGAMMSFLKPEALQAFVGRMDAVIRQHFLDYWQGKESVTVLPLMRKLTFEVACDLFFSLKDGQERELLSRELTRVMKGCWCLPLDFPGTTFRKALNARSRICKQLLSMMEKRRKEIAEGRASPRQDLMSCLLCMKDENNRPLMEEEITDNLIIMLIGGHDTTFTLLTHLVRLLALNSDIYQNIVQEQTKVLIGKQPNEPLGWEDIQKMKYTWRVAQETLRLIPPIFGGFRKAIKDVEYEGYTIPKGWQLFWETSTTHMNGDIFKEPHKFDPSHFETQIAPYNFTTFGGGSRICPGYNFSKVEMIIFLHHLVSKYKWSAMISDETIICNPGPIPSMGLPIKLQAKES